MNGVRPSQLHRQIARTANRIYKAHLPDYLKEPWERGKGKWYEDWLREQLDILVIDEVCDDPERLGQLKDMQEEVALVFGIFGAAFRILDFMGLQLRGQTLGQYDYWPEDEALLTELCQRFVDFPKKASTSNPLLRLLQEEEE